MKFQMVVMRPDNGMPIHNITTFESKARNIDSLMTKHVEDVSKALDDLVGLDDYIDGDEICGDWAKAQKGSVGVAVLVHELNTVTIFERE
jgi:hypothetical protein